MPTEIAPTPTQQSIKGGRGGAREGRGSRGFSWVILHALCDEPRPLLEHEAHGTYEERGVANLCKVAAELGQWAYRRGLPAHC